MALAVFNPPVQPSPGTTDKPEVKLLEAEFGDGYTQVAADGMNHIRRIVTLKWDCLLPDQAEAIMSFLRSKGGCEPFLYTVADDSTQVRWTCKEFSRTYETPNTVTATFRQDFSLGE